MYRHNIGWLIIIITSISLTIAISVEPDIVHSNNITKAILPEFSQINIIATAAGEEINIYITYLLRRNYKGYIVIKPPKFFLTDDKDPRDSGLYISGFFNCLPKPFEDISNTSDCKIKEVSVINGSLVEGDGKIIFMENRTGKKYYLVESFSASLLFHYIINVDEKSYVSKLKIDIGSYPVIEKLYLVAFSDKDSLISIDQASESSGSPLSAPDYVGYSFVDIKGGFEAILTFTTLRLIDNYLSEIYSSKIDPDSVSSYIKDILSGEYQTPRDKAEELYYWVRDNIDYIAEPITYESDNPQGCEETLTKRSGDCEDLSILLASMLNYIGIPAKLVALDSRRIISEVSFRDIITPDFQLLFDHIIVVADLSLSGGFRENNVFLDPSCKTCIFGQINVEQSPAMIIDSPENNIFPLPMSYECKGSLCGYRCYNTIGICCDNQWLNGKNCCNTADCPDGKLCINNTCILCNGLICGNTCLSYEKYRKPCCSEYNCKIYEICSENRCRLNPYIYMALIFLLFVLAIIFIAKYLQQKKFCPYCRKYISKDSKFCKNCGSRVDYIKNIKESRNAIKIIRYMERLLENGKNRRYISGFLRKRGFDRRLIDKILYNEREYIKQRLEDGFFMSDIEEALKKKGFHSDDIEDMAKPYINRELKNYIEEREDEGMSRDEIIKLLKDAGYSMEDIRKNL